jgi:hypothetical protein
LILLLAYVVITPLVARLVILPARLPWQPGLRRVALSAQPVASLCAGAALLPVDRRLSVAFAGVWMLYSALLALVGLALAWRRFRQIAVLCQAAALIYTPIGALWFLMARAGVAPFGFTTEIVSFTAAHFHYIPLAALTLTGLVGVVLTPADRLAARLYRMVAAGMLAMPLLVATGITLTQLTGMRFLESTAAMLLALNVSLLAALLLRAVAPQGPTRLARMLLSGAGASVLVSMGAAMAYAFGNATGAWMITYPQMLVIHGWVNALLFGACGLLGFVAWRAGMEE